MESGFIIALLRNNTISVHSLNDLEQPAQTIALDPALGIRSLSYSPYGISIRDVIRDERLSTSPFTLLSGKLTPSLTDKSPAGSVRSPDPRSETPPNVTTRPEIQRAEPPTEEPEAGSGLTPPSSPKFQRQPIVAPKNSSLLSQAGAARGSQFSSAIAETLLIGPHSVCGLTPTPAVVRLEQLCAERRMDEAMSLVDDERRKGRRGEIEADKVSLGTPDLQLTSGDTHIDHEAAPWLSCFPSSLRDRLRKGRGLFPPSEDRPPSPRSDIPEV